MIISISGVDCCGKTNLAKDLASYFNIPHFSHEYINPSFKTKKPDEWQQIVYGINLTLANLYSTCDNFVKDRYSIDEYVYQQYYNRHGIDWRLMDFAGMEKQCVILIDIEYDKYLGNVAARADDDEPFTFDEFTVQRKLFIDALLQSACPFKIILNNDSTYENLFAYAIDYITKYKKDNFNRNRQRILTCQKCALFSQCKQCNPEYNRPILPWHGINDTKFLFVGLSPGRANNVPFSNYCFTHSSGKYLKRALSELGMWDESAFCNICNCNTPADKIIPQECANICMEENLFPLINSLQDVSKVFILGNYAQQLITDARASHPKLARATKIFHPSTFNYGYSDEKFAQWKKQILNVVNG